jgi:hypothetical protein
LAIQPHHIGYILAGGIEPLNTDPPDARQFANLIPDGQAQSAFFTLKAVKSGHFANGCHLVGTAAGRFDLKRQMVRYGEKL